MVTCILKSSELQCTNFPAHPSLEESTTTSIRSNGRNAKRETSEGQARNKRDTSKGKNKSRGSGKAYTAYTFCVHPRSTALCAAAATHRLSPLGRGRTCTILHATFTETVIPATAFSHPRWMVNLRGEDAWSLNILGRVD